MGSRHHLVFIDSERQTAYGLELEHLLNLVQERVLVIDLALTSRRPFTPSGRQSCLLIIAPQQQRIGMEKKNCF